MSNVEFQWSSLGTRVVKGSFAIRNQAYTAYIDTSHLEAIAGCPLPGDRWAVAYRAALKSNPKAIGRLNRPGMRDEVVRHLRRMVERWAQRKEGAAHGDQ